MRTRIAFLVVAVLFTGFLLNSNLHAQIAIYDYRGTAQTIGAEATLPARAAGNLVIDLTTYEATYIGLISMGAGRSGVLYFQETPLQNVLFTQIYGPRGASYTVVAKAEAPGTQYADVVLEQSQAVGQNSWLTIQTLPTQLNWILPRSLVSTGFVIAEDTNYDYLSREKGTYRLNTKLTILYNNASLSSADFVSFVRNYHTQRGVQELVLPPAN